MASCTAICFLGKHDRDNGGIQIKHMMRLYENDANRICIEEPSAYNRGGKMLGLWLCTAKVLDDMMLLGAMYALKDEKVIRACREAGCGENTMQEPWELYSAADKLPRLYEQAREAYKAAGAKLVLISLTGSQMALHADLAKDYHVDLELCPAVFERHADIR